MSWEHQEHDFDRSYGVGYRFGHKGGASLGLYIANHVVQIHGGSIHIKSTPNAGSEFTVHLPM